jgi:tetratricopeptide (TPR) repeat protein
MPLTQQQLSDINKAVEQVQDTKDYLDILRYYPCETIIDILNEHPDENLRIAAFVNLNYEHKLAPGVLNALNRAVQNPNNSLNFRNAGTALLESTPAKPAARKESGSSWKDKLESALGVVWLILMVLPVFAFLASAFKIVKDPAVLKLLDLTYSIYPLTIGYLILHKVVSAVGQALKSTLPSPKQLGGIQIEQGRNREAIETLKEAVSQDRQDSDAWYLLGLAYDNDSQVEEALRCYEQVLIIHPYHPNAWNNRGRILYGKQDLAGAKDCFEKAQSFGSKEAENNLAAMRRFQR